MTIQLSISVWTLICFVLLMVILHNVLFKPLLEVMDKRKKRIESAERRKTQFEAKQREYDALSLENSQKAQREQNRKIKENIEQIRVQSKEAVETANRERIRSVDEYRVKSAKEQEEILAQLGARATEIAQFFADSLVKE